VAQRLAEVYAGDVAALSGHVPDLDLTLWKSLSGARSR
jgi:hypothetical protein